MDTERYVKCSELMGIIGSGEPIFCSRSAKSWAIVNGKLDCRCSKHSHNNFYDGYWTTFTNLQDALAALAMERL